jgi:hypothetical protein
MSSGLKISLSPERQSQVKAVPQSNETTSTCRDRTGVSGSTAIVGSQFLPQEMICRGDRRNGFTNSTPLSPSSQPATGSQKSIAGF